MDAFVLKGIDGGKDHLSLWRGMVGDGWEVLFLLDFLLDGLCVVEYAVKRVIKEVKVIRAMY